VLEHAFVFDEPLKVEYKLTCAGVWSRDYAKQLTDVHFEAYAMIMVPLALVPKSEMPFPLNLGGTSEVIRNPWWVNGLFAREFAHVFYGRNTFEIKDGRDSNRYGTHRWLELMHTRGYLRFFSRLNINISIAEDIQTKWHLRRVSWALLTMRRLNRLVINVDMGTFIAAYSDWNTDIDFLGMNASLDFKQWPVFRMLLWSRKEIQIFVLQLRKMEI
jgi:hypothetical protein